MCALVLALRKIPIYAPGGGGAALGSADQPTYSVSVPDSVAAANRDAFAKAKEAKRFVPTSKPAPPPPTRSPSNPFTRAHIPSAPSAPPAETSALTNLNTRNPTADPAHEWQDSPPVPSSPPSDRRSSDLEEVRGLLHRQSTRGKRKGGETVTPKRPRQEPPGGAVPTIEEGHPLFRDYAPGGVTGLASSSHQQPLQYYPTGSPMGLSLAGQSPETGYFPISQNGPQGGAQVSKPFPRTEGEGQTQRWKERNNAFAMEMEGSKRGAP